MSQVLSECGAIETVVVSGVCEVDHGATVSEGSILRRGRGRVHTVRRRLQPAKYITAASQL